MTTRLMEILDRDAAIMRAKMAEVMPAADGEAPQARELMILPPYRTLCHPAR